MTKKDPPTRGVLVPADGSPLIELPPYLVGEEVITWPPEMPEKRPGEPVKYLKPQDFYHRHLLQPEDVYVYVQSDRDANALPDSVVAQVRELLQR